MKRFFCFLLTAVLIFSSVGITASAAVKDEIAPLWDNINTVYACITINETLGIATCTGQITARNTYPVAVDVSLQRLENGSWTTVKTWSASGNWDVSCTKNYAIYRGYTYRVYVTGYVYNAAGTMIIESGVAIHSAYF